MALVPIRYNVRSLFVRFSSTILTVFAVGATIAVFAGMLGVTLFGLVLTPVFYVVVRKLVLRKEKRKGQQAAIETHA